MADLGADRGGISRHWRPERVVGPDAEHEDVEDARGQGGDREAGPADERVRRRHRDDDGQPAGHEGQQPQDGAAVDAQQQQGHDRGGREQQRQVHARELIGGVDLRRAGSGDAPPLRANLPSATVARLSGDAGVLGQCSRVLHTGYATGSRSTRGSAVVMRQSSGVST